MSLFTRLTFAMVALVVLTGTVIGVLAYRTIEATLIDNALQQIHTETVLSAQRLEGAVRSARSDANAFASAVAVEGIMRASLADAGASRETISLDEWRSRLARRFAAELQAKPIYSQFRLIGVADKGREIIRVDRSGPAGSIRIVPDDELQQKGASDYFIRAIATPPGDVFVSAVQLNRENGEMDVPHVPTLHTAAVIPRPDKRPFAAIVINVDLRGLFERVRSAGGGKRVYLINESGDFLIHPDPSREFAFEFHKSYRLRDEFPTLPLESGTIADVGERVVTDRSGERFGVAAESVRLSSGPRVTLINAQTYDEVLRPVTALRNSILFGGALALFGAIALALIMARSLSRPLAQMTASVEAFAQNRLIMPPTDAGGEIGRLATAFSRMSREIRAQAAELTKENAERRRLFDTSLDLIFVTDRKGTFIRVSPSSAATLGYQPDEMIGRSATEFIVEDDLEPTRNEMRQARRGQVMRNFETRYRHKDGHEVVLSWSGVWSEPEQSHFFIGRDMTEAKWAEEAIRDSERAARAIIDTALDAFIQLDESGAITDWSPQAEMVFGWPRAEAIGRTFVDLVISPEERDAHLARFNEASAKARDTGLGARFEESCTRVDGMRIQVEMSITALKRRDRYVLNGFVRDITEKLASEEKLRHGQKMEAIGQLTGGIAHDFNNMLTVITGTIEILQEGVADRPELEAITKLIAEAADRGAELTSHLLAFARKQPLRPRDTDVNALIVGAEKLVRTLLGENIEIVSSLKPHAWPAFVDHSQLTTALVNLAVNARDAMPEGGKLTIESDNMVLEESYTRQHRDVVPGEYVMIAITDTGTGIPEAVRAKVFEPFFTTKEAGKGTGLGLSMVYGFVKQSNGHITLYSEEGQGTSIRIYLPRAGAQAAHGDEEAAAAVEGGSELVLVVEDDPLVRSYVIAQLQGLGYQTLAAANAAEALAMVEEGAKFDLLFTDVIMPGAMNGRQLAEAIAAKVPDLKVLYTSGYTETALIHHGRLDPGVILLNKPYRRAELARMIRSALAA